MITPPRQVCARGGVLPPPWGLATPNRCTHTTCRASCNLTHTQACSGDIAGACGGCTGSEPSTLMLRSSPPLVVVLVVDGDVALKQVLDRLLLEHIPRQTGRHHRATLARTSVLCAARVSETAAASAASRCLAWRGSGGGLEGVWRGSKGGLKGI
eukprot:1178352-Prorocentrum_minimum.AAC.5